MGREVEEEQCGDRLSLNPKLSTSHDKDRLCVLQLASQVHTKNPQVLYFGISQTQENPQNDSNSEWLVLSIPLTSHTLFYSNSMCLAPSLDCGLLECKYCALLMVVSLKHNIIPIL